MKASRIERFILELEAEGSKDRKISYLNLGLKARRIEGFIFELRTEGWKDRKIH